MAIWVYPSFRLYPYGTLVVCTTTFFIVATFCKSVCLRKTYECSVRNCRKAKKNFPFRVRTQAWGLWEREEGRKRTYSTNSYVPEFRAYRKAERWFRDTLGRSTSRQYEVSTSLPYLSQLFWEKTCSIYFRWLPETHKGLELNLLSENPISFGRITHPDSLNEIDDFINVLSVLALWPNLCVLPSYAP